MRSERIRPRGAVLRGLVGSLLGIVLLVQTGGVAQATVVQAPDFNIVALNGERYSKAALQRQPTLLLFWAPRCRVCQKELWC